MLFPMQRVMGERAPKGYPVRGDRIGHWFICHWSFRIGGTHWSFEQRVVGKVLHPASAGVPALRLLLPLDGGGQRWGVTSANLVSR